MTHNIAARARRVGAVTGARRQRYLLVTDQSPETEPVG
jgi:hypothetical protein